MSAIEFRPCEQDFSRVFAGGGGEALLVAATEMDRALAVFPTRR